MRESTCSSHVRIVNACLCMTWQCACTLGGEMAERLRREVDKPLLQSHMFSHTGWARCCWCGSHHSAVRCGGTKVMPTRHCLPGGRPSVVRCVGTKVMSTRHCLLGGSRSAVRCSGTKVISIRHPIARKWSFCCALLLDERDVHSVLLAGSHHTVRCGGIRR